MPSLNAITRKLLFSSFLRPTKSNPSLALIFFALILSLITSPQGVQAQGTSVALNWAICHDSPE
jgi:hypothetical protein